MKVKDVVDILNRTLKYGNELALINKELAKHSKCYDSEGTPLPDINRNSKEFIDETNARRVLVVRKHSILNEMNRWLEMEIEG